MEEKLVQQILELIDSADDDFMQAVVRSNETLMRRLTAVFKELELNAAGNLKPTVKNLRLVATMEGEIQAAIFSKEYTTGLAKYGAAFNKVAALNNSLFQLVEEGFEPGAFYTELANQYRVAAIEQLTEKGINAVVIPQLQEVVRNSIANGSSFANMVKQVDVLVNSVGTTTLVSNKYPRSLLSSYANQITTDALNQFNAAYIAAVSTGLGNEWFQYVGSNIRDTRAFCKNLTEKRWVHRSELPVITRPDWDGKIPGTNAANFKINRGGYRCRHQLYPVSAARVPKEVRDAIN